MAFTIKSFLVHVLFLFAISTNADQSSNQNYALSVTDCPTLELFTVTAIVTALGPGSNFASNGSQPYPTPVPVSTKSASYPVFESCFDRNQKSFSYTYDHGTYQFGSMGGAVKTEGASQSGMSLSPPLSTKPVASSTSGMSTYSSIPTTKIYTNATSTYAYPNSTSTTSSPPANSTAPSCEPDLQLDGASENGFNKINTPFSVKIVSCSKFNVSSTTAFANYAPIKGITVEAGSIIFPGFVTDYVLLSIFALDMAGTPIIQSYELHFGNVDMPILVLDENHQPASGVLVQGDATIYPGVSQECTTDASGKCSLVNLPPTTIGLVAKTSGNSIAVGGLATTSSLVTLKLLPFATSGVSSFDVDNGTTGWTGGTISQSQKIKRDTTLSIATNGQYNYQSTFNRFDVHPLTKIAYIKYKFVTSEVPGGYFGTRFNDYYSVTIRSDTGAFVTVTNSMNALGIGAFDAQGATDWFTLTLKVPANTKSVRYDIGVSNVADNLYDSSVVVGKVGDLQCDQCGDCASCPSDATCQQSCKESPLQRCDFYKNCAEAQLGCGADGYPLHYGLRMCNRFDANRNKFTTAGRDWMYRTMNCLQRSMVPVLQGCKASCKSFSDAAFASHPKCYVDNGFCSLKCPDLLVLAQTVAPGLTTIKSLGQVLQAGGLCLQALDQTLQGCIGDITFVVSPATYIALTVLSLAFKYLSGESGS